MSQERGNEREPYNVRYMKKIETDSEIKSEKLIKDKEFINYAKEHKEECEPIHEKLKQLAICHSIENVKIAAYEVCINIWGEDKTFRSDFIKTLSNVSPEINRLDLSILLILANENATDELKGMTINEINFFNDEDKPLSGRPNLSKRMRRLYAFGLIDKGIKDVISDTYYVTELGLKTIKWNGGSENE